MKKLIILSLCVLGFNITNVSAQSVIRYTNACESMGFDFDSNLTECMTSNKGKLFSSEAVTICAALTFEHKKLDCLRTVANKSFYTEDLALCTKSPFDDRRIECLTNLESLPLVVVEPGMTVPEFKRLVLARVIEIKSHVESGNLLRALRSLSALIELLE